MREWKNKLARFLLVLSALCMAVNLGSVRNVQAAEGLNLYKRVPFYNSQKVGGSIYSLKYNDSAKRYNIYVEKNGKKYFQGYTAHYVKVAVELTENDTKLEQNEVIVVDIQGFIDEYLLYGKVSIEF